MTEARIQLLDDLGSEFARVAAEHRPRTATARRTLAIALSGLVLLGGSAYAVPTTRAAIEDLTSSFAGWVAGDAEQAPGRALRPDDDAPDWVREKGGRLIAETARVGLYVTHAKTEDGVWLDFALDEGVGIGAYVESWRERFDDHAAVILGPTVFGKGEALDEHGRFPLLGVTARSVKRVELRYTEGPALVATDVDGGFVLIADAWRPLSELIAYDATGRELDRTDASYLDMRYLCEKEPDCPRR